MPLSTYEGGLNTLSTDKDLVIVRRKPSHVFNESKDGILYEFRILGVDIDCVEFFSFEQQATYTETLERELSHLENFNFQDIILATDEHLVRKWINGIRLDEALSQAYDVPLELYLCSIFEAHKKGLFYGDGWPPNVIVSDDCKRLTRYDIDFIVKDKEFEFAQAFYHILWFARDITPVIEELSLFLKSECLFHVYSSDSFKSYLKKHISRFRDILYDRLPFNDTIPRNKSEHYQLMYDAFRTSSLIHLLGGDDD